MTNYETLTYSYDAEGNRIEEQDIPHRVPSSAWFEVSDRPGSVRDLHNTSGSVIDTTTHDHFGNLLSAPNAAPFPFTAETLDGAAHVILPPGRCNCASHPTMGRWMVEDPVGFAADEANLSRYVGSDPTEPAE